ncbi:50S ribosomal protein L22 [uncultured archaeon]|nr:50S ribosomal protein L22 [uncultured archaeon]
MELKYSNTIKDASKAAKAQLRDQDISFKDATVYCKKLRGMKVSDATTYITAVTEKNVALPFPIHRKGIGHRSGQPKIGKYPIKVGKRMLELLTNLAANADFKGLDAESLTITHIQAQKGVDRVRRRPKGRWHGWARQYVSIQAVAEEKK